MAACPVVCDMHVKIRHFFKDVSAVRMRGVGAGWWGLGRGTRSMQSAVRLYEILMSAPTYTTGALQWVRTVLLCMRSRACRSWASLHVLVGCCYMFCMQELGASACFW
jgi:hypothetical protein